MSRPAASAPLAPDLPPELNPGEIKALAHDESVAELELTGVVLTEQRANGVSLAASSHLRGLPARPERLPGSLARICPLPPCDLTEADFRAARTRRCEFRRCDLSALEGIENLRGAALEWADIVGMAGSWAASLGIEILDPE
jgi:uncharacterized protein YjbI with pentapeptide repeats